MELSKIVFVARGQGYSSPSYFTITASQRYVCYDSPMDPVFCFKIAKLIDECKAMFRTGGMCWNGKASNPGARNAVIPHTRKPYNA